MARSNGWRWALVCLIAPAFSIYAQITGEIRGVVSDPSGSAIPAAGVVLTSTETGETRKASTDAEGRFSFALLKIGDYSVTVEAQGFRRAVAGAVVRSAEVIAVNVKMEVGQVSEQVTITDAANPLDTQQAQLQESFEVKEIQETPVARNPNLLAATLPGIVPNVGANNSGSFHSSGNRSRSNNITIDNITATDISVAGTGSSNNQVLNFSSIKEVKIITNNFSAEFGRNSGAQVQYITKSGTNDLHGEAYNYLRNNIFNARDWFDRSGSASITRWNQFGGVLGGPIVRNKTHFFVATELNPIRGSGAARVAQVPTPAMIAQVTDPTSRRLLEQYKLPAATTIGPEFGTVQQNASNLSNAYQWSARIDHQLSSNDTLWGRFATAYNEASSSNNTFINTNIGNFGLKSNNRPFSANISETHIFGPTVVNEFRAGFGRTSPIFTLDSDLPAGPRVIFVNNQVNEFGHNVSGPQGRIQNTYQVGDTLNWTRGAHNVKIGGDFFRYQMNSFLESNTRGTFNFNSWDDFAAGRLNQYSRSFGNTVRGFRTWLAGIFAQDDFRVTRSLTLNLGFRVELFGPNNEVNGLTSYLNLECRDSLGIAGSGAMGCPVLGKNATPFNPYYQPRVGFAWNPRNGKTVIRGGYGMVADFNFTNPITNMRNVPPLVVTVTQTGVQNFTGANSLAALYAGNAPLQTQALSQVGAIRPDVLNFGDFSPLISPNLGNPQIHQWSFGVQRELPGAIVLKAAYVGTKSNFLQRNRQINLNARAPRPAVSLEDEAARVAEFTTQFAAINGVPTRPSQRLDPRFNVVNLYDNSANANYHAFEFLATRSFRNGYSLQVAYTAAKSIDDTSDALSNFPNDLAAVQNPNDLRNNRALSIYDLPQRWVATHVWEIPWGARLSNKALRTVLGGWGFSGIQSWRAGYPATFVAGPRMGVQNIGMLTNTADQVRANAAGPFTFNPVPAGSAGAPSTLTNDAIAGRRISAYAASLGLSQPLLGNFGTLGRNTHRLNGRTDFDWNFYKTTKIGERWTVQIRAELYNTFNNTSFRDVNRNISNAAFGQYTTVDQGARIMQLGAVIRF